MWVSGLSKIGHNSHRMSNENALLSEPSQTATCRVTKFVTKTQKATLRIIKPLSYNIGTCAPPTPIALLSDFRLGSEGFDVCFIGCVCGAGRLVAVCRV